MDDTTPAPRPASTPALHSARSTHGERAVGACVVDAVRLLSGPMNAVLLGAEVTRLQALDERASDTAATALRVQQEAYRCAEQLEALRAFGTAIASTEPGPCELAQVIAQLPPPFSRIATVPTNLTLPVVLMPASVVAFALMALIRNASVQQASEVELLIERQRSDHVLIHALRPEAFVIQPDAVSVRLRQILVDCLFAGSSASLRAPLSLALPVARVVV